MTDRKGVLVRFPPEILADMDAEAKRTGKSRNDIIVARCERPAAPELAEVISPRPSPQTFSHGRSKTVVVATKRTRIEPPAADIARREHVHTGYPEYKPGSLAKKR